MATIVSKMVQVHIVRRTVNEDSPFEFLVLQRSDVQKRYPAMWQVVTGKVDEGETMVECAKRELFEETGLVAKKFWTLPYVSTFYEPKDDTMNLVPVFGVEVSSEDVVQLSVEHQNYEWLNDEEAFQLLELPSHHQGHNIFLNYILESTKKDVYTH